MRESFDQDLVTLKNKLYEMGSLSQRAVKKASQALQQKNLRMAEDVIVEDRYINKLEEQIEELIVQIITAQQPVATDLRKIISTLKVTSSLERIGDFAVDIAKASKRLSSYPQQQLYEQLPIMFDTVLKMVKAGMDAYMEEDVQLAKDMASLDDYVDGMYADMVKKLLESAKQTNPDSEHVIQLAYVARYIERIADHATNISEAVYYIVRGERVDLNQ